MHWREIAWNGIRCETPDSWEVVKIGPRYLMLAEKSESVMEVKWGQIKGRFSHQSHLRRLAAQHRKKFGNTLTEVPLPPDWKGILSGFSSVAFSWHSQGIHGLGAVLYCSVCKTATLIQFFHKDSNQAAAIARCILTSFRDHHRGDRATWALFDIRATLPAEFSLTKYRFDAGHYELMFSHKKQKITLWRWAPSSVLLQNRSLGEFARVVTRFDLNQPISAVRAGIDSVEWRTKPPKTWGSRLRSGGLISQAHSCCRFWHLGEKNRILGVKIEGGRSIDFEFLDGICAGYEII